MNSRLNRMDWASVESPTERNIHPILSMARRTDGCESATTFILLLQRVFIDTFDTGSVFNGPRPILRRLGALPAVECISQKGSWTP